MTKIYLIRHCEAQGNDLRLFQGAINLDITELGAKQLEFLSERFKNIHLDAIYSSPLIRAQKTAFAVKGERFMDVKIDNELREISAGKFDGKPFSETFEKNPDLAKIWYCSPQDFAPEGGESMRHAYERIYSAVKRIADENPDKAVAIALHGGVIRCLMARIIYGTIEKIGEIAWAENTAVALVDYQNGEFKVEYRNDTTHLPEEYLPVRNRLSSFMSEGNEQK